MATTRDCERNAAIIEMISGTPQRLIGTVLGFLAFRDLFLNGTLVRRMLRNRLFLMWIATAAILSDRVSCTRRCATRNALNCIVKIFIVAMNTQVAATATDTTTALGYTTQV